MVGKGPAEGQSLVGKPKSLCAEPSLEGPSSRPNNSGTGLDPSGPVAGSRVGSSAEMQVKGLLGPAARSGKAPKENKPVGKE